MENFEKAAEARLEDWNVLNNQGRRVGTIHMGGIYIECLLKAMICCKNIVTDGSKGTRWKIEGIEEEVPRPSHDLTAKEYYDLLQDVYDDMSQEVMDALRYISKPENLGYIDYRYISEESVTDDKIQLWMLKFIQVFNYLRDQMSEL